MGHFVYILLSTKDKRLYVGETADVKKRLHDHKEGRVASTRKRRPLELIKLEEFHSRTEALRREQFLKSPKGWTETKTLKEAFFELSERGVPKGPLRGSPVGIH